MTYDCFLISCPYATVEKRQYLEFLDAPEDLISTKFSLASCLSSVKDQDHESPVQLQAYEADKVPNPAAENSRFISANMHCSLGIYHFGI